MAKMYPDDIEDYEHATEGEKQVFKLNKEASFGGLPLNSCSIFDKLASCLDH